MDRKELEIFTMAKITMDTYQARFEKAKKNREALLSQADDRNVHGNLGNYEMDKFSMHRA